MALNLWKTIGPADQTYCEQFVKIMQRMDSRYRAFAATQLQDWLAGTTGPYVGDTVSAFAWFPRTEDIAYPTRMQIVVLGRYQPDASNADMLMLGWTPASPDSQAAFLDPAIDEILAKGADWLGTLNPAAPVKTLTAIRPYTMNNEQVKRLQDRLYERAVSVPALSGAFIRLVRERPLQDASYWLLQLIP